MRQRLPHDAGFSLVEAMVGFSITLATITLVVQGTGMVESIYQVGSDAADGTAEAKWALDDIVDELARAGYGMGAARAALPFLPDDPSPSSDRITLRSNPEGRTAWLRDELVAGGISVAVTGAERFHVGDQVLLTDRLGSEKAEVLGAGQDTLTFRSHETADGSLRRTYSPDHRARILGLREARFGFDRNGARGTLWKEVSDGPRRVLSRGLETVAFEHLDSDGQPIMPSQFDLAQRASAIRVHLSLGASSRAASISSLTTAVALGRHSVTIDLPMVRATHLTEDRLIIEFGPVIESPMGLTSPQ